MAASDLIGSETSGFALDFVLNDYAVRTPTAAETLGSESQGLVLDFVNNDFAVRQPWGPQYPASLPAPLVSGFSAFVAMGVIRSEMDGHQAQRRVHRGMPHRFTLSFVLAMPQWAAWQAWISSNGYRWFEINLPTMYAGLSGARTGPVLIRLVSPVTFAAVTGEHVQASAEAEMAPSMIAMYLEAP